jgi:hypothetical protein
MHSTHKQTEGQPRERDGEGSHVSGGERRRSSVSACVGYPEGASDSQPARGPKGGDPGGCEPDGGAEYGNGKDRVGDERSANGSSNWELSETSNSSEMPESRDSGEGELGVRGGRKLLRRRGLVGGDEKVCRAVRTTAGRRAAAAQTPQGPTLVERPEGEGEGENMNVDEQLTLMPLQQAMREASMRRELQVPRLTGQLQLQLGQQIGGGLLEFMNQIAQRLGSRGHRGTSVMCLRDCSSAWRGLIA